MEEVQSALWKLVTELANIINAADDAVHMKKSLHCLASLLHPASFQGKDNSGTERLNLPSLKTLEDISTLCREKSTQAVPETPSENVISRAFYGGPCFAALAQLLLNKVAVDWLACFSLQDQTLLFDKFFTQAPLSEALSVLVAGLSVTKVPGEEEDEGFSAVDNLTAACGQAERLLSLIFIDGQGVKKLALSFSSPNGVLSEAVSPQGGKMATYRQRNARLAQLLSSMPERISLQAPTALQSLFYTQSVGQQLLGAAEEIWTALPENDTLVPSSNETFKFIGEVIGGLCRRGHADIIASQMVPALMQHVESAAKSGQDGSVETHISDISFEDFVEKLQMSFWPSLPASITDSYALERFSEALIKEMTSRGDFTDWQACCSLRMLFGKLIEERATTRSLFFEKFLFGKILPIRSLKWVLDFAILQTPPASDHWVRPEGNEDRVNKNVVRRLAEEWSTKEFIQSALVQKQAYLTAAFGICLGSMSKDTIERLDGFVPSLMKGISNRLDSPLMAVRQMAKRIALVFSITVDPEKPLLFDEDDTIEELLNWQGLENLVGQKFPISNSDSDKKQNAAKVELEDDDQSVISKGDDRHRKQERRRRRKEKEEKLALEEDDPDAIVQLGVGSLEDDSEESSDSEEDSCPDLQPYDISDEEDDDSKGKFVNQLADLTINLRKGDKPDAALEALNVAEKFILAMPEELDNLAADLAHALVHVKCSSVAVEGEEDRAEEMRQRALLALLSCSPLKTVSVLTNELFSVHVDASQRILILEIMSGGARLLANTSDENKGGQLITRGLRPADSNSWFAPIDSGPTGAGPWIEVASPSPWGSMVSWAHKYERELPQKPGHKALGRSRRWGHRAMQLRKDESLQSSKPSRMNRFAPLAAAFMLPVMRDYDKPARGLELLGQDFLILGGVLSMLGICIECLSMQPEVAILGAGLLEMLRSGEISSHPETFVRRNALFAASRVLVALNPSDLAASLTGGVSSLVANLEWVREWALDLSMNDVDTDCSMMATACVQLFSEMAMQMQRAMDSNERVGPGEVVTSVHLEVKMQTRPPLIMPF